MKWILPTILLGSIMGLGVWLTRPTHFGVVTDAQIDEIAQLEEAYFAEHGEYLQILPGNKLPSNVKGLVGEKLGKDVLENIRVDVYDGPQGKGFQVIVVEPTEEKSKGYGAEAQIRTYTKSATST